MFLVVFRLLIYASDLFQFVFLGYSEDKVDFKDIMNISSKISAKI